CAAAALAARSLLPTDRARARRHPRRPRGVCLSARIGRVPAFGIRAARVARGRRVHRRRAPSAGRGKRAAGDGARGAGGGGCVMARSTSALATTPAPGVVHAEAPVPVSSDPLRLLRAFPASRRFLWLQPATGQAVAAVGASVVLRARGTRRFSDLSAALADVTDGDGLPAGVVAVGGFAFDASARQRAPWRRRGAPPPGAPPPRGWRAGGRRAPPAPPPPAPPARALARWRPSWRRHAPPSTARTRPPRRAAATMRSDRTRRHGGAPSRRRSTTS